MEEKRMQIMYELVSRLSNQGDTEAQCILGFMEFCGDNPDGFYEPQKAVELFRKSAEQGWACAQYNLGWCYLMSCYLLEQFPSVCVGSLDSIYRPKGFLYILLHLHIDEHDMYQYYNLLSFHKLQQQLVLKQFLLEQLTF